MGPTGNESLAAPELTGAPGSDRWTPHFARSTLPVVPRRPALTLAAVTFGVPLALAAGVVLAPNTWFYRDKRPTRLGRAIGSFMASWSGLGLPPSRQAALETTGRKSGRLVSVPVVIAHYGGERYLVSMLGPGADWVRNVEASDGRAALRQGRRTPVLLELVPAEQRAPILQTYLRLAPGARPHFSISKDDPLPSFEAIAGRYPVFLIRPATTR